jgi:hypothetical protein
MKMPAKHVGAESMKRIDLSTPNQQELPSEARIIGCFKPLPKGLFDPAAHFGGGGVGEGNDQQFIDVAAVFAVADQMGAAFRQDRGLPTARGGGDEQVYACRPDRSKLILRPLHAFLQ